MGHRVLVIGNCPQFQFIGYSKSQSFMNLFPFPNAQCPVWPMPHYPLAIGLMFQSFFMGGFECSTHRLLSRKRLDVTAATCHDKFAAADYQRL
jgi:hypothetical protein